jgi:drug/metabolite transporter (DMT)-like permease
MTHVEWLWIPVTVWAAFAQTLRNVAQRHLSAELGTLGATLVRFLYGLPFALAWLVVVVLYTGEALPAPDSGFALWLVLGAFGQVLATALMLAAMAERNFTLGVAYSKTEIIQVALFGFAFLGDAVSVAGALAIGLGTLGVLLMSPVDRARPIRSLLAGWTARPALLGLASGACFAISAVSFRGAALSMPGTSFLLAAAFTLLCAQALQSVALGGWLLARTPQTVVRVMRAWRTSLVAGFMGAAASAGWFTAMAIEPVAHVRTLGLIELLFSSAISRKLFRERLNRTEVAGMLLLVAGLAVVALGR